MPTIFGVSCANNTGTTLLSSLSGPRALAFDAAGNLWTANYTDGTIRVLPIASGTLFGVSVTANTPVTITTVTAAGPWGIAFDSVGHLFISDFGHSTIKVLPKTSVTIFGTACTANVVSTLFTGAPFNGPANLTLDAAGNLYCANSGGANIVVVARSTGSIFGTSCTANTPIAIAAVNSLSTPRGISFDSVGNLFYSDGGTNDLYVLPASNTTIFGQGVFVNTQRALYSGGLNFPRGMRVDSLGNVYIAGFNGNLAAAVPVSSGSIYGVAVSANAITTLLSTGLSGPSDVALDAAGNLYIVDFTSSNIVALPGSVVATPSSSGFLAFA